MDSLTITGVILGGLASISVFAAALAGWMRALRKHWIDEAENTTSQRENTKALSDLTRTVERLSDKIEKMNEKVLDNGHRLTVLENTIPFNRRQDRS